MSIVSKLMNILQPSPKKKLTREWLNLMKEARDLQRKGMIPELAKKTAEANAVLKKLEELERNG